MNVLTEAFKQSEFFCSNPPRIQEGIVRNAHLVFVEAGSFVFHENEVARKFYMIIEGVVEVLLKGQFKLDALSEAEKFVLLGPNFPGRDKSTSNEELMTRFSKEWTPFTNQIKSIVKESIILSLGTVHFNIKVAKLKAGSSFGEIGLLEQGRRTASIRALTECHFAALDKKEFESILLRHQKKEQTEAIKVLEGISMFQDLEDRTLKGLRYLLKKRIKPRGSYLFKEGEESRSIFILISGSLRLEKNVPSSFLAKKEERESLLNQEKDPNPLQRCTNTQKCIVFAKVFAKELIGEEDVFFNRKRKLSCVSEESCLVYEMNGNEFLKRVILDSAKSALMKARIKEKIKRWKNQFEKTLKFFKENVEKVSSIHLKRPDELRRIQEEVKSKREEKERKHVKEEQEKLVKEKRKRLRKAERALEKEQLESNDKAIYDHPLPKYNKIIQSRKSFREFSKTPAPKNKKTRKISEEESPPSIENLAEIEKKKKELKKSEKLLVASLLGSIKKTNIQIPQLAIPKRSSKIGSTAKKQIELKGNEPEEIHPFCEMLQENAEGKLAGSKTTRCLFQENSLIYRRPRTLTEDAGVQKKTKKTSNEFPFSPLGQNDKKPPPLNSERCKKASEFQPNSTRNDRVKTETESFRKNYAKENSYFTETFAKEKTLKNSRRAKTTEKCNKNLRTRVDNQNESHDRSRGAETSTPMTSFAKKKLNLQEIPMAQSFSECFQSALTVRVLIGKEKSDFNLKRSKFEPFEGTQESYLFMTNPQRQKEAQRHYHYGTGFNGLQESFASFGVARKGEVKRPKPKSVSKAITQMKNISEGIKISKN